MKRLIAIMLLAPVCLFAAETSQARPDSFQHEILVSGSRGTVFHSAGSTSFSLNTGYNYSLNELLQMGISPAFEIGENSLAVEVLAGPTFNYSFNGRMADALFLTAQAGMDYFRYGSQSGTNAIAKVEFGKRFEIVPHVIYRPSISFSKRFDKYSEPYFTLNVLAFSVNF